LIVDIMILLLGSFMCCLNPNKGKSLFRNGKDY